MTEDSDWTALPGELAGVAVAEDDVPPERPEITLRPYQHDAIDGGIVPIDGKPTEFPGIHRALIDDHSTLLILPTGLGKTITFGAYIRRVVEDHGWRALVLAHREELILQASGAFEALGVEHGIEWADRQARGGGLFVSANPGVVIASKDTLQTRRLATWDRDYFDLIVTDEGHHATAKTYRNIYAWFAKARRLFVTATADRLDGANLGDAGLCKSVAYNYPLTLAIDNGFLAPLDFVRVRPDPPVDLREIRTTAGDLNAGDLEDMITANVERLVNVVKPELGERPAIAFLPDVGSAQAFAQALNQIGISARSVSGMGGLRPDPFDPSAPMTPEIRSETMGDFKARRYQVLVNCQVATEGFDAPHTEAIILCRPTKSRSLYTQMVGRGTRLSPGKDNCLVIDFAWISGKHKLVSPIDLFDSGTLDFDVEALARSILDSGKSRDVREAIDRAKSEILERQRVQIQVREREVRYRRERVSYDAESVRTILGVPRRELSDADLGRPASPTQIKQLRDRFGVERPDRLTASEAGRLIRELDERARKNLASHKQVSWLVAKGIDLATARKMTKRDASDALDKLFNR